MVDLKILSSVQLKLFAALSALLTALVYGVLIYVNFPNIEEEVDWFSVFSEGLLACFAGIGVFLTVKLKESRKIDLFVGSGLGLLLMAFTSDTLDEFVDVPDLAEHIVEGVFQNVGFLLLVIGMGKWVGDKNRSNEELKLLASTDVLTGALNRLRFLELVEHDVEIIKRNQNHLCVVMIDIDYFKSFNDNYGHQIGDEVLKAFTESINANLRQSDLFCRYGGEEFIIALMNTQIDDAENIAEKLRVIIKKINLPNINSITASFGIAEFDPSETVDDLIGRADEALYMAKSTGRDKVVRAEKNVV